MMRQFIYSDTTAKAKKSKREYEHR